MTEKLKEIELYAWLGEDELGSGEIGIKRGIVPAGDIPLVAIKRSKIENLKPAMQSASDIYGKKRYLCRFKFEKVVDSTI